MELFSSISLLLFVVFYPPLRKLFFTRQSVEKQSAHAGRLPFFDFAKGVAIIAVIFIHSIYLFEANRQDSPSHYLDILNNIARFAVGVFFISSGALLSKGVSSKKILKVILPFVVVSIIVGVFQGKSWDLIIGGVIRGDLLPPYYFIPVLLQFYLMFPLLLRLSVSKYFLPLSLLVSYVFYITPGLSYILGVPTFGPFLFLFAFGVYHRNTFAAEAKLPRVDYLVLLITIYVALCFVFPGHYYNSRFFYAPAVFMVLHFAYHKFVFFQKISLLQSLGKMSLWVYLVHFSIEELWVKIISHSAITSVYLYILLISILTVSFSGVVGYVLNRVYGRIKIFDRSSS